MNPATRLPFAIRGELHDIHLINFSVDPLELLHRFGPLPKPLKPRLHEGRALISMVDVQLRKMRAATWWLPFRFSYQHVAFRLLVEDESFTDTPDRNGIFFLKSFTNRPMITAGGNRLTNFNFQTAHIDNFTSGMRLSTDENFIAYDIDGPLSETTHPTRITEVISRIDRAYAVEEAAIWETRILRDRWPLRPMHCNHFSTNFFNSARLEAVHKVPEPIPYTWLPPRKLARVSEGLATGLGARDKGQPVLGLGIGG